MAHVQSVALFCEDTREEVSGAVTLVGVMTDNLGLPGVPGVLHKLVVYTRVLVPVDYDLEALSAFLRKSSGEELGRQAYDQQFISQTIREAREAGAPHAGIIITTVASPFPVPEETKLYMVVEVNGEEQIAGYLNLAVRQPNA